MSALTFNSGENSSTMVLFSSHILCDTLNFLFYSATSSLTLCYCNQPAFRWLMHTIKHLM